MKKSKTRVMGIDFGIVNAIFIAFNDNNIFYSINSSPRTKNSKFIKSSDVDKYSYKTALFVINMAFKHQEDLSSTEFTRNQFYFELQRVIQHLAEEKSIRVRVRKQRFY